MNQANLLDRSYRRAECEGFGEGCPEERGNEVGIDEINKGIEFQNLREAEQRTPIDANPQMSKHIEEADKYFEYVWNSWEIAKNIGMWSRKEEEVVEELCKRRMAMKGENGEDGESTVEKKRGRPRKDRNGD